MIAQGFLLIPTGRDLIAPGHPLLPGDDKLLPAMTGNKPTNYFMWRVFGLNFVTLSIFKFLMLSVGVAAMNYFICFAIYGTIAVVLLATHKHAFDEVGADITPFLGIFTIEMFLKIIAYGFDIRNQNSYLRDAW